MCVCVCVCVLDFYHFSFNLRLEIKRIIQSTKKNFSMNIKYNLKSSIALLIGLIY